MQGLFGGEDNGAAERSAQAQIQAQREAQQAAAAQEQSRYEREQQRIASEKASEKERLSQEEAKRNEALEKQRLDSARQQEAQHATGTGASQAANTAKILAAANNPNLPSLGGTSPLKRNIGAANQIGGYQGQSNTLLSQSGFNTGAPGGRKYQ